MNVKFSGIAWQGNEGFYYSSYDKPEEGSRLSGMTDQHKLFNHRLGTPQSDDRLVFGGEETPRRYIGAYMTEDERLDRKSVVSGKRVSVRVDLGGRRNRKKK